MKYITPSIEIIALETVDILTASSEKYLKIYDSDDEPINIKNKSE